MFVLTGKFIIQNRQQQALLKEKIKTIIIISLHSTRILYTRPVMRSAEASNEEPRGWEMNPQEAQ